MIPAQRDLFATFSPAFAGGDIRRRALLPPCWCFPELMRLAVEVTPTEKGGETDIRVLRKADVLASNQGALSWRLRIATTLARLYLARDEGSETRAALEPVCERFKQGFSRRGICWLQQRCWLRCEPFRPGEAPERLFGRHFNCR
jgi:hypothetical protein